MSFLMYSPTGEGAGAGAGAEEMDKNKAVEMDTVRQRMEAAVLLKSFDFNSRSDHVLMKFMSCMTLQRLERGGGGGGRFIQS